MKSTFIKCSLAGALTVFLLQSCAKKDRTTLPVETSFTNKSLLRVFVTTVNANRNYVYVDGKALNGSSLTSGSVFPASGVYASAIDPGFRSFLVRDTLTATTQAQLSFANDLQGGNNYSVFLYDTINSPKQVTVQTNYTSSGNKAWVRFANMVYSPIAVPAIDIYSARKGANVFSNVSLSQVSSFIPLDIDLTDTFYVRVAGTGVNLQNYKTTAPTGPIDITTAFTPRANRSYTLVFRGGYRATATSNTTVRTLSVFTDY